ncbi:GT-D fold domain-containing glycosyltransferase [Paenibacillus dokdonensis]|uniref:GT-D fold domain-containing protein n=1 Tax=Paenibacillus dokdonensis TaxID=2567944 RepID=UPI001FEB4970|nr:GT-D fold domain-containing glycosyltransferase [Paenibacillus dokdonensis]
MNRQFNNTAAFIPLWKKAVAVKIIRKPKVLSDKASELRQTKPEAVRQTKPEAVRQTKSEATRQTKSEATRQTKSEAVRQTKPEAARQRKPGKKKYSYRRRSNTPFRLPRKHERFPNGPRYRKAEPKPRQKQKPFFPPVSTEPTETCTTELNRGYGAGGTAGTEEEMASLLPPYTVLPEVSAREIMAAGLQLYLPRLKPLLRPEEVHQRLEHSLAGGQPLSVVRLGDGELLALAHDTVLPLEHARSAGHFLTAAGMTLPDYHARSILADAVRKADIIGIPFSRLPTYQGLLFPVLRYYGIDYGPLIFTTSTINYALHEYGFLQSLLRNKQVLVIGNLAEELARKLTVSMVHVAGVISPVNGFPDIPRVLSEASMHSFDIALVASGIPAVVICQRIATELGKSALDFGHLADKLISGELSYN